MLKRIFETVLLCGCNAVAKNKDECKVDVLWPVPEGIAKLLTRDPWPGNYNLLKVYIQPHANFWYKKPKGRYKAKFEGTTKPPLDCSHKLLRVRRLLTEEVESLEIFPKD